MRDAVVNKICEDTQRFADILKKTQQEGGTVGDALLGAVQAFMPPADPERMFFEWFIANKSRLRDACNQLGIALPEQGKGFYQRLKALAIDKLTEVKNNARLAG